MASDRRKILRAIQRESRQIRDPKARKVFRRAAVQTGIVESGLRNLSYGDADSQGWRQERASLYKDPTNVKASVRRFREEFEQHYQPGEKSYEVAPQIQRPREDLRGRYKDVAGQAEQILKAEVGKPPNTRQGASYGTKTIPGVDRSEDRKLAKLSYLENRHDPDALLNLGLSLRDSQDTPSKTVKVKLKNPTSQPNVKTGSGQTDIKHIIKIARRHGLHVGENTAAGGVHPVHTEGSYHYRTAADGASAAADISGTPAQMRKFARVLARRYGRDLEELIWRGPGSRTIKKGKRVPKNFYSQHTDHVHVADID